MSKKNYSRNGKGNYAGAGGGRGYSNGQSYSSRSANLNIPYENGGRIRLGDLARSLLGNREYGSFGSYTLKAKHKTFGYVEEDRNENEKMKCPRCGHDFNRYRRRY